MKLTLKQKKFLIVWILFHSFALFVNLAYIRGEINLNNNYGTGTYHSDSDTSTAVTLYLFISGENKGFWPFTSYYYEEPRTKPIENPLAKIDTSSKPHMGLEESIKYATSSDSNKSTLPTNNRVTDYGSTVEQVVGVSHSYYGGIFNAYGFAEYVFYMVLGFAVIYVPKIWKSEPTT